MKGIILHGGSGIRLRPLTYSDVKQLLPIAGKPISEYALENLISIGIKDVNIIVGNIGSEEVRNYYGNGEKWGINITYTYQEKPLGIANAIYLARDFVGNDDFIVYLGDNYLQKGINYLYDKYKKSNYDGMIALVKVKNPSQFGIAEIENDKITKLVEKPKEPKSNLAIAGIYFLKPFVFDIISRLKPSWRGEYEITEAYQMMIDNNYNIGYSIISGWFKDTGTVDDFLECNRLVLDSFDYTPEMEMQDRKISGRVYIGNNVSISEDSSVLGPCYIGENSKIENSYIGPFTSMGSNSIIKNAEIENSIIMDNAKIEFKDKYYIRESLIGSNVDVKGKNNSSKGMKLVLGRDSKVELL
jgi:glucose-1-phosphate thymidylyltransferase